MFVGFDCWWCGNLIWLYCELLVFLWIVVIRLDVKSLIYCWLMCFVLWSILDFVVRRLLWFIRCIFGKLLYLVINCLFIFVIVDIGMLLCGSSVEYIILFVGNFVVVLEISVRRLDVILFIGVVIVKLLVLVWINRSCGVFWSLVRVVFVWVIVGYWKYFNFWLGGNIFFFFKYFLFELYRKMVWVVLVLIVLGGDCLRLLFVWVGGKVFLFCGLFGFWRVEKWFFVGKLIRSGFDDFCFLKDVFCMMLVFVVFLYVWGLLGLGIGLFKCFWRLVIFFFSWCCFFFKLVFVFESLVFFLCNKWFFFWSFWIRIDCWCRLLLVDFICDDRLEMILFIVFFCNLRVLFCWIILFLSCWISFWAYSLKLCEFGF